MSRKSTFIESGKWFKGNTHMHTTFSDGRMEPKEAVDIYREAGYSFVVITDHWHYGNHRHLESEGFLIFAGMEMDLYFPSKYEIGICHHVTVMADPDETPFKSGDRMEDVRKLGNMEAMVDFMNSTGHICIYAHPGWSHIKMEEYDKVDCLGMEIFNFATENDTGLGYADTYYNRGLWENRPRLCFACDDAHDPENTLGGFICVKAADLTYKDILESIRKGSFYASTGPAIYDFYVEDGVAYVECSPCSDIYFYADTYPGVRPVRNSPGATSASYVLPQGARGVYAVCCDGNKRAWTQIISLI